MTSKMASKLLRRLLGDQSRIQVDPKVYDVIRKYWKPEDNLDEIMIGPDCISTVYSFTYNNNWDQSRLSSIPSLGSKLVLKLYSLDYCDVPPKTSYFCAEILALTAIATHNAQSDEKIGVPEIFDYGIVINNTDENQVWSGYFILMSYIEDNEDEMCADAVEKVRSKINADIKRLNSIGLAHGDLERRNMRYNETNPMLIDYSHASSKEIRRVEMAYWKEWHAYEREMEAIERAEREESERQWQESQRKYMEEEERKREAKKERERKKLERKTKKGHEGEAKKSKKRERKSRSKRGGKT